MVPPPPPQPHAADATLLYINSNPYFIGIMMLILNLGGRFISLELSKNQEAFFQNVWVRRFLIFTVLFIGTRNVAVAFWLTIFVVLVLSHLFNENSSLFLFSKNTKPDVQSVPTVGLSYEESLIYKTLQDKMTKASKNMTPKEEPGKEMEEKKETNLSQNYLQNMFLLRSEAFANPRF